MIIGTVVHYIIIDLLKKIFYVKNPDSILLETSCLFACFYSEICKIIFFFFFFTIKKFYWGIVDLQCVSFKYTVN